MRNKTPAIFYLYQAITRVASPLVFFHLWHQRGRHRILRDRWQERLGQATKTRSSGPLLWFHAVSVGESAAAVPIIKRCLQTRPSVHILVTTRDSSALSLLERLFKQPGVTCQYCPADTPQAVESFLWQWQPQAAVLMESELWPNLLLSRHLDKVPLALLNARISPRSFQRWDLQAARPLVAAMLSRFSLIAPPNTTEAIRLQLLGAPPSAVHFAGNLKYATNRAGEASPAAMELRDWLSHGRPMWLAASTHPGEEALVARVHRRLALAHPTLLTLIAPRHPQRATDIVQDLVDQGFRLAQRSQKQAIEDTTEIYLADTIGELSMMYEAVPVALVAGSLLPGLKGHNLAEAASSGCAVLTGHHVGHFGAMLADLQRLAPLSVWQVDGEAGLADALTVLLSEATTVATRREAARHASAELANGVVDRVWEALDNHVLSPSFGSVPYKIVSQPSNVCCEGTS